MRLAEVGTGTREGRRRIEGSVVLGDGTREQYWFDVPESAHCAENGDAWVIALLPLAMSRGESIEVPLPVDPLLIRNLEFLQGVWKAWFPALSFVDISAPRAAPRAMGRRVVSCFSGGLDSFFTLIRNHGRFPSGDERRVTDIMFVHGADVPVDDQETYGKLRGRYATLAAEFGVGLLDPRTNFRTGSLGQLSWPDLTHAVCLAACGTLLGRDFGCLLIPSGAPYRAFRPWGSTPLTDPLFTSSWFRVEHDGAQHSRTEKTEFLSTHPVVQRQLRVCWRSKTDLNCGRCAKCLRTMAALEAFGQLDAFTTFPRDTYSYDMLARIYCRTPSEYIQMRMVHTTAVARGRDELARALSRSIGRSERLHTLRTAVGFVEGALGIRGLGSTIERRVLSRSVLD